MKNKIILVILILSANIVCAQNWVSLQGGISWAARVLYPDTVLNKLFVGGNLAKANNHFSCAIAAWDGASWDTLNGGLGCCNDIYSTAQPVCTITRYQNNIYAGGFFTYIQNPPGIGLTNGFTRWNGSSWDSINVAFHSDGYPYHFCQYNNLLYCNGAFDSVVNYAAHNIAAWNGTDWIPFNPPNILYTQFEQSIVFQNKIYFAGGFSDTIANIGFSFLTWDGANWGEEGVNFGGLIHALAVYNNELYIGGQFLSTGEDIEKYDGTNFYSVGCGLGANAVVENMKVFNNKLYVVGYFDSIGSMPANDIGIWDGTNWAAFSSDMFHNGAIDDIAVFNNELYITGGFTIINSDSTFHNIAKYDGWTLGENEIKEKRGVSVYPNPASTIINVHLSSTTTKQELIITDVLGNEVYHQLITNNSKLITQVDVSQWSEGVYFYQVNNGKEIERGKFVVER